MRDPRRAARRRGVGVWAIAAAALVVAVLVRNFTALDVTPPGMYIDESSIGYNAWAIAHYGVDEHGIRMPLYFDAFGEYKNPVYVYTLAALLRVLPLTAYVERLPAALYASLALLCIALAAWRITGSRWMALGVAALASVTPWLVQEGRVGFEVISMVALLCAAVWCIAGGRRTSRGWFVAAGVLFALAIFAYSAARIEVLLFAVAFVLAYRRSAIRGWWLTLVPLAAGYAVVAAWALLHPGALTAEFAAVSIAADHPALPVLVGRFFTNYAQFFTPDFLFIHGDPNLRHNTGYAGMLLAGMLPLLAAGLVMCWRRRREPFVRFVVACLVVAPLSGAITEPAPHALRDAVSIPFWFALASLGLLLLRELRPSWRRTAGVVVAAAAAAQGALYLVDMYTAYPVRAALFFDAGVPQSIRMAASDAAGHTVWLGDDLEQAYIQALFALTPPPPRQPVSDSSSFALHELHMRIAAPLDPVADAAPGDLLVLPASDPQPAATSVMAVEDAPQDPLQRQAPYPLVVVYRVG